jgi:hypothetical protein
MDFSRINDEFGREIIRGGEAYLDGMLRVATSADQRASFRQIDNLKLEGAENFF